MNITKEKVREAIKAKIIIGDGHTLFMPEYYAPYFTLNELTEAGLVENHQSDGSYKGTIFSHDGSVVDELKAVYNLDFLYWVAIQIGADTNIRSMGRGSQAQELVGNIHKALAE
jgi:hypothetical protein